MGLHLLYTKGVWVQAEARTTRPTAKGLDLTTPQEEKGARLYSQPTRSAERVGESYVLLSTYSKNDTGPQALAVKSWVLRKTKFGGTLIPRGCICTLEAALCAILVCNLPS